MASTITCFLDLRNNAAITCYFWLIKFWVFQKAAIHGRSGENRRKTEECLLEHLEELCRLLLFLYRYNHIWPCYFVIRFRCPSGTDYRLPESLLYRRYRSYLGKD